MTKICLSIFALAALSSAGYARVSDNCFDYCATEWDKSAITTDSPFAVKEKGRESTNYERMKNIFEGAHQGSR